MYKTDFFFKNAYGEIIRYWSKWLMYQNGTVKRK